MRLRTKSLEGLDGRHRRRSSFPRATIPHLTHGRKRANGDERLTEEILASLEMTMTGYACRNGADRHGFQAASLNNILAKTGLTKGALYHHFPDKDRLGYAVIEEVIRDSLDRYAARGTGAQDRVRDV